MILTGIASSFSCALPLASGALSELQSAVLEQIAAAEAVHVARPFDEEGFRTHIRPLTQIPEIEGAATEAIRLAHQHEGVHADKRSTIHRQIGQQLATMRSTVTEGEPSLVTPEGLEGGVDDTVAAFRRIVEARPVSGMERFFGPATGAPSVIPSPERLPEITSYLEGHLAASREILTRLERVLVWGTPQRESLPDDIAPILSEIEMRRAEQGELTHGVASLTTGTADSLSQRISRHYLRTRALEQRIAAHETLGRVFRSEIVNSDWALAAPAIETGDEGPFPALHEFFERDKTSPAIRGRVETLIRQYERLLRDKKGGGIGRLEEQPFDLEAFATALVPAFDPEAVTQTLDFFREAWGVQVPGFDDVRAERDRITAALSRIEEERRPLFPAHFIIEPPTAEETVRRYLGRLNIPIDEELFREVVGVRSDTVFNWGREKRTPSEIGLIMALYRYCVEAAWRQETLSHRTGGIVTLPDPMELLRLCYGEWAEAFFDNTAGDDPWVIEVPVPEGVFDLSYSEMFYGRVLQKIWETYELRSSVVAVGVQQAVAQAHEEMTGVTRGTYDRHRRGRVMPHRRYGKTRESMRHLIGPGGDVFDFFLEAKSVIDQVARVHLPGRETLLPPVAHASNWQVRLVPHNRDLIDLTGVIPSLDPERYPYRYLEGDRDGFTLLLGELRARLDFLSRVQGLSDDTLIRVTVGEPVSLGELRDTLEALDSQHNRQLARLQYYRDHPAHTPMSAPQNFEQFYRRVLLFARTVRDRIGISETVTYEGLSIHYVVSSPQGEEGAFVSLEETDRANGAYRAVIIPDRLMELAEGGHLDEGMTRDLFRLALVASALEERGLLRGEGISQLAVRLFPERTSGDRERLVALRQTLEELSDRPLSVSPLNTSNDDVLAIYARADRVRGKGEGIPPERLERWLAERFTEFSWNRFGISPLHMDRYLQILSRYFELHPQYAEEFSEMLFNQAINEVAGEGPLERRTLLEFLFFVSLPTSEEVTRRPATPLPAPAPDLPPIYRRRKRQIAETPIYPSRQGVIIDDFLDRQAPESLDRELVRGVLLQLAPLYAESVRAQQPFGPERIVTHVETILREQTLFLGTPSVSLEESQRVQALARGFADYAAERLRSIDSMASAPPDAPSRWVAREILLQMIFHPELEPLGSIILEVLKPRISNTTPQSGAYTRTLKGVQEWFAHQTERMEFAQSDLEGFFEIAFEEGLPKTRDDLVAHLIKQGRDLLPTFFGQIHGLEDWEGFLDRYEFEMTLFNPEGRGRIRRHWQALYNPLPAREVAPSPPPPSPPGPGPDALGTRPTPTLRLPARTWDAADYAPYLPAEAQQAFWGHVRELAGKTGEAYLLLYLTEEGAQVARVSRQEWQDAQQAMSPGTASPLGGKFFFQDLATDEPMEILPTQLRQTIEVDDRVRTTISWLAGLTPEDPSFADIQALQALALFIPVGEAALTDFHQMVPRLIGQPSRRALRQELNRFTQTHREALTRYRNYYHNMGPWHFSAPTLQELGQVAARDLAILGRLEKVRDLLEYQRDLPDKVVRPLQEAIRRLEESTDRTVATYLKCIEAFLGLWGEAIERDAARLARMLPAGEEFQSLAASLDFLHINTLDLAAFRQRTVQSAHNPESDIQDFYRDVVRILDRPEREPVHRVLYLMLYPGLFQAFSGHGQTSVYGPLIGPLVTQMRRGGRNLHSPRRAAQKEQAIRELLQFYLDHRAEILWRLYERREEEGFTWVGNALPDTLPPRYSRSDKFPELEAITYHEIDQYRHFLMFVAGLKGSPDVFCINVDRQGLWHRLLIPPDRMVLASLDPSTRVPIGIRGEEGDLTLPHQMLRTAEMKRKIGPLPPGGRSEITVPDIWGRRHAIATGDLRGEVRHAVEYQRSQRHLVTLMALEHAILNSGELRDVHPILLMIFNTVFEKSPSDDENFRQISRLAETHERYPGRFASQIPIIRQTVLGLYRNIRPSIGRSSTPTRFSPFFNDR